MTTQHPPPVLRRPAIIATTHGNLISLAFPTSGTLSATTNLGIVWADPADHTQALGPANGIDFTVGCGYTSLNLPSVTTQTLLPTVSIQLYIVDSSGADMYLCGNSAATLNAAVFSFDVLSFSILSNSTPGNGIRGQLTISGTYSIQIPSPMLFFGSIGPT